MSHTTTAGRLLETLFKESTATGEAVASAAGILPDRAAAARDGTLRLTLSEQLRLSEATTLIAPQFTRQALRLRGQALAARSYEQGAVQVHQESPAERWERSSQLRR